MEIAMARGIQCAFGLLATASTAAIVSSIPINIWNVVPQWAEVAMPIAGILNAPGSIISVGKMGVWLADAKEKKKILEVELQKHHTFSQPLLSEAKNAKIEPKNSNDLDY